MLLVLSAAFLVSFGGFWNQGLAQQASPQPNNVAMETTLTGVEGPPTAQCLESPEGQLLRATLAQVFESVTAIEILATASSKPCARAVMSHVFELERKFRHRILIKPKKIQGSARVEVQIRAKTDSPQGTQKDPGGPISITSQPSAGSHNSLQTTLPAVAMQLDPSKGAPLQELPRSKEPLGNLLKPAGDSNLVLTGKADPKDRKSGTTPLERAASPEEASQASEVAATAAPSVQSSAAAPVAPVSPVPLSTSAAAPLGELPSMRSRRLTLALAGGFSRTQNSGDEQDRTGPAAGLQLGLRGLFERVKIAAAVDAVRPSSGPATQGLFFEAMIEFEPATNISTDRHGPLVLGGVRSFASSTEEESANVRRIRPASESTPVLSNSPVVGLGYWYSPGAFNMDGRADVAPVLSPNGFEMAYSGSLTVCYSLSTSLCLGSRAAHQQIKVGAKSGTANFASSSAALWLNLTLD
jgi:hypothetical protein